MREKKRSRKHEENSSSDNETETDSSNSSSQSPDSSPETKKPKGECKKQLKRNKSTKHEMLDDEHDTFKKNKLQMSDDECPKGGKDNIPEQSKWDSPREKPDRRDKKSEKYRRSNSLERVNSKSKSRTEKEHNLERRHKDQGNDWSRDYNRHKNDEKHRYERREGRYNNREYQNDRHERKDRRENRNRDENSADKNRKNSNKKNEDYSSKRYDHGRTSSTDRNKNRSDGYQSKYRNRSHRSRSRSLNPSDIKWGKEEANKSRSEKPKEKEKPNFALSGKLTEETNTYRGIVIKYSEPPEARKPKRRWRLYPFKGEKALQTLYIHRESAYLIGRERKVVDLPVDHPSCSKQHAVLQYRLVPFTRDDGSQGKRVRPYLIDLDSANGTFINNKRIDPRKYVELLEKDVIKFGYSSREYVLLHENSKDEAQDDDVKEEEVFEAVKKEKE